MSSSSVGWKRNPGGRVDCQWWSMAVAGNFCPEGERKEGEGRREEGGREGGGLKFLEERLSRRFMVAGICRVAGGGQEEVGMGRKQSVIFLS